MRDRRFLPFLSPLLPVACLFGLALGVPGQSVTEAMVDIGGPGALGSEGGDPPTLSGGSVATGTISYRYDSSTGLLDVTVANTSPQILGEVNPLITRIYFNLPYLAVTGATLRGQSTAFSSEGIPLRAKVDVDSLHKPNPVRAPGFGRLNVELYSGMGIKGGIANPAATSWPVPTSKLNMGPVTFSFQLTGPHLDRLTATTFATTPSVPPSRVARAVFHFQGGGTCGNDSAAIGTSGDCVPGLWYVGEPCLGETITFLRASAPGCHGCLLFSMDPTPTVISGIPVPISPPYIVIAPAVAASSIDPLSLLIPERPELVGLTGYFVFAVLDPVLGPLTSEVVAVTVCE